MAFKRDFRPEEFVKLPQDEQVAACWYEAERAEEFGDYADPKHRALYIRIAEGWACLANLLQGDLERGGYLRRPAAFTAAGRSNQTD